ncbi:MAG: hypothetical protein ACK4PM_15665, partial [Acinetobacter junii]
LNITKISGKKYGDEFEFKVTDEKGNVVPNAEVEIFGEKLKANDQGIVKKVIKTIQTNIEASASKENYKSSSLTFDVEAIGKLKIIAPEKVDEGSEIVIKVTDENNNPVENAELEINKEKYITDKNGEVKINATTSLSLKAGKEGYISSEKVTVEVVQKVESVQKEYCGDGK